MDALIEVLKQHGIAGGLGVLLLGAIWSHIKKWGPPVITFGGESLSGSNGKNGRSYITKDEMTRHCNEYHKYIVDGIGEVVSLNVTKAMMGVNDRLDRGDGKFDSMENKMYDQHTKVIEQIGEVGSRVSKLEGKLSVE